MVKGLLIHEVVKFTVGVQKLGWAGINVSHCKSRAVLLKGTLHYRFAQEVSHLDASDWRPLLHLVAFVINYFPRLAV